MDLDAIDTPALLVDLDTMERNQRRLNELFKNKSAGLRPHFKNHRVLMFADLQMASGAIGITCARLWQAERLIRHGIRDVLLANEIAGEPMIRKFIELSRMAPVIVGVDDVSIVGEMARLAGAERGLLNLVVDFDLGLRRCGVADEATGLALARRIVDSGMRFRGVMGYEGHLQPLPPGPEKERVVREALAKLVSGKNLIERDGIPVEIVSCGGTGDCVTVSEFPGVTEAQPGSYLLMDSWYAPFAPDFHPALGVLATVISRTGDDRLVVDAGVKAISGERGLPSVLGFDGLRVTALHAEHAPIEVVDRGAVPKVGEKIQIRVHYHDGTVHLHPEMYGIRNQVVEDVFPIEH